MQKAEVLSMKRLSISLFVLLAIQSIPTLSSGLYDYDDNASVASFQATTDNLPSHIPFINIDLQPTSLEYIKKWAKITAGVGAFVGGYIMSSNLQARDYGYTSLEKLVLILGGAAISGGISSFIGSMVATLQTEEKRYEHSVNSVIQLHNDVYTICTDIGLTQQQRYTLSLLLVQDFHAPNNRAAVYRYIYSLAQKQNKLSAQCVIKSIVNYLDGLAYALERELYAAQRIITQVPSENEITLPEAQEHQIADTMQTIAINQQIFIDLNALLSPQLIRQWTDQMRKMPEYNIEQLRAELTQEYAALEKYENDIRYKLARLSALHGKVFSRAYLTKTFGEYVWHSFITDYADTPEGRRARMADIAYTKNDISSAIQSYQSRACLYSNKVITFNAQLSLLGPEIQYVMQSVGKELWQLRGYEINVKLLEYNTYLNHNDGDALWTWVQGCF